MADAGRILIMPKGNYNPSVSYEMLDLVFHNDVSWIAKKPVIGFEPSEANADYWFKMVDNSGLQNIINGTTPVGNANAVNGVKFYNTFTEIDSTFGNTTPVATIGQKMPLASILNVTIWQGSTDVYPMADGILEINKSKSGYIGYKFTSKANGKIWTACGQSADFTGWKYSADGGNADTVDGKHASDFLPITGGTLKSELYVNDGHIRITGGGSEAQLEVRNEKGNTANRRMINVRTSASKDIKDALALIDVTNGTVKTYNVLHTANVGSYALPLDGSVPMSGKTMELNKGWAKFEQAGGHFNIIQKQSAEDGSIDSKNMRWLTIYNAKDRATLTNALEFTDYVNGSSNRYNVLHTGNSAKVVVSSTPLTAEGSIRVW